MKSATLAAATMSFALAIGPSCTKAASPIVPPLNGATPGQWLYLTLSNGFNYDVLLPYQYSTNYTYPVVLYLHGVGTEAPPGTPPYNSFPYFMNNTSVQGVNYRADFPAIVVAPQCAGSAVGSNDWGGTSTTVQDHKLTNLTMPCGDNAIAALQTVMAQYSADPKKVYITGYSMGGFGVYYRYATNPNLFAAAIPVSGSIFGGVTPLQFEKFVHAKPIWSFHGFNDQIVSKTWDEDMYRVSMKHAAPMKYIEFVIAGDQTSYPHWLETTDGDGHDNADTSAFQAKETLDWLFAQKR